MGKEFIDDTNTYAEDFKEFQNWDFPAFEWRVTLKEVCTYMFLDSIGLDGFRIVR